MAPVGPNRIGTVLKLRAAVAGVLAVAALVSFAVGQWVFGLLFAAAAATNVVLVVAIRRRTREP